MLKSFRRHKERRRIASALYARLAAQARAPGFHTAFGVSDTFDGRFDLLVLHAWMVLEALQGRNERELAQQLVDGVFARLDEALREQGAGDMGISRRMKAMAGAFYGRLRAYGEAADEAALAAALLRNVYRGEAARIEQAALLAKYISGARARLVQSVLAEGEAEFGPVSAPTGTDDDDSYPPPALS